MWLNVDQLAVWFRLREDWYRLVYLQLVVFNLSYGDGYHCTVFRKRFTFQTDF